MRCLIGSVCVCLCNARHWRHIVLAISGQAQTHRLNHTLEVKKKQCHHARSVASHRPTDQPTGPIQVGQLDV